MKSLFAIGLGCIAAALLTAPLAAQAGAPLDTAGVVVLGAPTGFVNDFAHVLSRADVAALDTIVRDVRAKCHGEIAVVTVPTLAGHTARGVAVAYANRWGVGYRGRAADPASKTGVVVLLAPNDRQVFVATGDGARVFLTDAKATAIARLMTPAFAKGRYGDGLVTGVSEIAREFGRRFHFTPRLPSAVATAVPR